MGEKDAAVAVAAPADAPVGLAERKKGKGKRRKHRASLGTRLIGNLHKEDPAKASWVVGVLFFKNQPDFQELKEAIGKRLLDIPRFRSRLVPKRFPSRMDFVELKDEEIDLDYHFRQKFEDKTTTIEELDHFLGHMFEDFHHPKDYPLWQVTYVPKLEDGRACIITNISHIVGDGIAQIEVLMRLLDKPKADPEAAKKALRAPAKRKPPKISAFTKTRVFLGGVAEGLAGVVTPADRRNTLRLKDHRKPSATKRCCFSKTIELDRVKALKNMYDGATLNDILVTLLSLTLRAYYQEAQDKVGLKNRVRAQFPINLRSKKQGGFRKDKHGEENPYNRFAYGFLTFHTNYKGDQSGLLWKIKGDLDLIKHSPSPFVQLGVGKVISQILPLKVLNDAVLNLAAKATAQISNVPGPQQVATLGGHELDDMRFLLNSPLGFYVGLLTYNGKLSASFCLDSKLPEPELLAKHWLPEFEKWEAHAKAQAVDGKIVKPKSCCC